MAYGVTYDTSELYLSTSQSLSANFVSAWHETHPFDMGSIQMIWSGADATDGVLMVQVSNDKENWADISSVSDAATVCAASGTVFNDFPDISWKYWRVNYTANSITTGTISILSFLKRRR